MHETDAPTRNTIAQRLADALKLSLALFSMLDVAYAARHVLSLVTKR
jgi:hypothetical protein